MIRIFLLLSVCFLAFSCAAFKPKKVDTRKTPINAEERARQNINQGKGTSLRDLVGRGNTNYEFSTSNPMWRASLEILDFLPMTTVDYSGGIIITDWYSDVSSGNEESIKITVRFLSNDIRSDSLKIIVHKKKCISQQPCKVEILSKSAISQELRTSIIKKASLLKKESTNKKKK